MHPGPADHRRDWEVIVVGAGFAGIAAGVKLRDAGIRDFIVLDKADAVGGVWRDNTYPGCTCDVPSALYSYSFAPKPDWQRLFAPQDEIRQYLHDVARRFGVMPHVRLRHELLEACWSHEDARWHLTVFQRTPQWILPKMDIGIPRALQALFKGLPLLQRVLRGSVYGTFEALNGGLRHPAVMKQLQRLALHNLHRSVHDPALRRALTPEYIMGCKRILQSNHWYPALVQNNVTLVPHGVQAVEGHRVIASDGSAHEVDTIILGTGFEITSPPIAQRIRGRSGIPVAQRWAGSPEGYLGTMVMDCPNAFLMFGPNLAVSSSAVIIIEAQLAYIIDALQQARDHRVRTIDVDPRRHQHYNEQLQAALQRTVWNQGGCQSYYLDANGRNSTAWPWSTFEMRRRLSRFRMDEHLIQQEAA